MMLRRSLRAACCAGLLPVLAQAAPVRSPCVLEPVGGTHAATALSPGHATAVANWDVHPWQRHRLWIDMDARNDGDAPATVLPRLLLDARTNGSAAQQVVGSPLALAPHASVRERLSAYVPPDTRSLAVRVDGPADASVSLAFAHACSESRFDVGTLAVPAAALLQEGVSLVLDTHADPIAAPHDAANIALRLATGAQDGGDVAWALRGMLQSLHAMQAFVTAPGEPPPVPVASAAPSLSFDWLPEGVAVLHLAGGDAVSPAAAEALAGALHDGVHALAARHPRGWIVDLRGRAGLDAWPALAGLSTLLSGPVVGASVGRPGAKEWIADRGAARFAGEPAAIDLQSPPEAPIDGPVAVLVDGSTADAGEALAVAFQGRPRTRLFGSPTAACPTWCLRTHRLADGTVLGVVGVRPADRNGRAQREAITPDDLSDGDVRPGVPRVALAWLLEGEDAGRR